MSVFDRAPADWQELQTMVAQLFSEMNCAVEIGKRLHHVRGTKEIDVYVQDGSIVPTGTYLCECKYWQSRVTQEVVHAFRTVMHDAGAHHGFIISMMGFQKGAFEAAENTNVHLVRFDELQNQFFDRWRVAMGERFLPFGNRLFPYWDYPGRMPQFKWNATHVDRQQKLIAAYLPLVRLGPLAQMERFTRSFPITLPSVGENGSVGDREICISSYRQLYDFIDANKDLALYHLQVLHGEIPPRTENEYDPHSNLQGG